MFFRVLARAAMNEKRTFEEQTENGLAGRLGADVLIMDGAFGTQVQRTALSESDWGGHHGCNEYLNLSRPDLVASIHAAYFDAGADAVETNSFGAAPGTLAEYGLAERAVEINRAAAVCAREAADACADSRRPRYVWGSIGPGTKLVSLGQTVFDRLHADYLLQIEALLEGGVDGILFETCQDMLQIKAGICAFEDAVAGDDSVPLYVSVTIEENGAMLLGSDIAAVVAILGDYPVSVLGVNCATGPRPMRPHLDYLKRRWNGQIAAMPNAGMPEMRENEVVYPLSPSGFAEVMGGLARDLGLNVVGGCCGTTPEHIRCLADCLAGFEPRSVELDAPQQAASLYTPVDLDQEPRPLYIGERANATGSRAFRSKIEAGDFDGAFEVLAGQEENGAHMVDLNVAYPGGDERGDMCTLVERAARECRLPLMVDTTDPQVVEAALKLYGGRAFINSINFEDGEQRARAIASLARRYGAGLVALTIDEKGMAQTAERKLEIAERIVAFCEEQCGVGRGSLLIDPLTFTVASGDESLRSAALETLEALRLIKSSLPGVRVMLGASNISFGLKAPARKVVNAVFLDMAVKAGLDAAIVNVAQLAPLAALSEEAIASARRLLNNDRSEGDPLLALIGSFSAGESLAEKEGEDLADEERIFQSIVNGRRLDGGIIDRLLQKHSAEQILNDMLVAGMAEVGRLFNAGRLQLPFVLKSAEAMKGAVDLLKPHMAHSDLGRGRGRMLLATVAGDVHDIGKNLVEIILSNNGFEVIDLGTKVAAEEMLAAVREHRPDVIGMSGLLVKSTVVMASNLEFLQEHGVGVPVFLGGAALNEEFVARECRPRYGGPVVYCPDAFAGLASMREYLDSGSLPRQEAPLPRIEVSETAEGGPVPLWEQSELPDPPFLGHRIEREIDMREVYPLLNRRALIRGRWGYRQRKMGDDEYARLIEEQVEPRLEEMIADCERRGIFQPRAAWGYFRCHGEGDRLWVDTPQGEIALDFPRSPRPPRHAIPDYFKRDGDLLAMMAVTMGEAYSEECARLRAEDEYERYFLFHGLDAELTDALAMLWHSRIRAELGFPDPDDITAEDQFKSRYRGARFGFGYAACPDPGMNRVCCRLVHAGQIGIEVAESGMMIPEVSTAALVVHNPQADHSF